MILERECLWVEDAVAHGEQISGLYHDIYQRLDLNSTENTEPTLVALQHLQRQYPSDPVQD